MATLHKKQEPILSLPEIKNAFNVKSIKTKQSAICAIKQKRNRNARRDWPILSNEFHFNVAETTHTYNSR